MIKKIMLYLTAAFLFTTPCGALIHVAVSVNSNIDGFISYTEVPPLVEESYQRFTLVWVNTGSISCQLRTRADVYSIRDDERSFIYSAWSQKIPSEPGVESTLVSYWFPKKQGNYSVDYRIYYCNNIVEGPSFNFTVAGARNYSLSQPDILDVTTYNNKSSVEFHLKPKRDIDGLLITPVVYPIAWIFESTEVGDIKAGETKKVRLGYDPTIWKKKNISFTLVSADGSLYLTKKVELTQDKGLDWDAVALGLLLLVVVVLSFLLFSLKEVNISGDEN